MTERSMEEIVEECAYLLQELGLTEYEAYVFISLVRLGVATAKDIAALGHVPRTRVYDAVDSLHEMGLVDIQYSSPRKFTPVSRETAVRKLELQRQNTLTELRNLLDLLEPEGTRTEEFGVWTTTGTEGVANRTFEFIEDATAEVVYIAADHLLTDDHLDLLSAATERGLDVYIAASSEAMEDRIRSHVPAATLFEPLWSWEESGAGRLLITDRQTALVSVLTDGTSTADAEETAIWGEGDQNSLVLVLRTIFTWRLDRDDLLDDPA